MTSQSNPAALLAEVGVTSAESGLLNAVHYGICIPPQGLAYFAANKNYTIGEPVSLEEGRLALSACLQKGWFQIVDQEILDAIVADIKKRGVLGPIYGLPSAGEVDFTPLGASIWQRICNPLVSAATHAYIDVVHSRTAHYFRTQPAAIEYLQDYLRIWQDGGINPSAPTKIGAWRVQWWRQYSEGFRLDIEEKRKWQGRCSCGNQWEWELPNQDRFAKDPGRLKHILNCHNVAVPEWLMMASIDGDEITDPDYLPTPVSQNAQRTFGLTATEENCRDGLEACLNKGWLRIVDHVVKAEIQTRLCTEQSLPRLSELAKPFGNVDFTSNGAVLYQMIASECLGSDWDAGVHVSREYYRKEHLYCPTREGFAPKPWEKPPNEKVISSSISPLGPWCVHWWLEFPDGYRLEREIEPPESE